MRNKTIVSAVLALTLGSSSLSFAQGYDRHDRDDHDRGRHEQRHDGRGVGPHHEFHRGQALPMQYRGRGYVVDNWRAHRLHAPPRGYQWVQVGGDFALIAIASGIIAQFVLES